MVVILIPVTSFVCVIRTYSVAISYLDSCIILNLLIFIISIVCVVLRFLRINHLIKAFQKELIPPAVQRKYHEEYDRGNDPSCNMDIRHLKEVIVLGSAEMTIYLEWEV